MVAFKLTVAPAVEPVLLADVKLHARIDATGDDALISNLIVAARQWVEAYTGRVLITQTWQGWFDAWPCMTEPWWDGVRQGSIGGFNHAAYIVLPRSPLQGVNQVTYYDNTDAAAVWPVGNYYVDTVREPGRLALRMGAVWPVPSRLTNGIMIEFVAGYGVDGSFVPEILKTAIRQLVSHWYEHRGEAAVSASARGVISVQAPVPLVIQALLEPYRVRHTGV